ncbi:hypothetical protein GLOTRDRAFT_125038 [Gloeophyllum trabeum ATCC 11539]|uniref:Stress-response A/B barrel domain-containing protein n=1 Tax=Gloeophyllum trabeum (strain ATCC 11539 / FP-39264 / Madison 617) TaxID=670483 RepID=S7QPL9_GLOTA|nr:uncharacterized protein GLOTRDRAFT_125038 [Gloeophyllum trabeum ATCC 11539]EPQ61317.1 hypothetical protein GLOTRDRAFT_125038 [Gloeophyllum trabeum ATCC 11539]
MPGIHHIALLKFLPSIPPDVKFRACELAVELLQRIPQVNNMKVGPPADRASSRGYDFALTMDFDSREAFRAYNAHPMHAE